MREDGSGRGSRVDRVDGRREPQSEHPRGERSRGPRIAAIAAITTVIVVPVVLVVVMLSGGGGESPADRLDRFLTSWAAGQDAEAARLTDDPSQAAAALKANRAGLDEARLTATVEHPPEAADGEAFARVELAWDIPEIGSWSYPVEILMHKHPDYGWRIIWEPSVVHPDLAGPHARLGTMDRWPERGRILDRNGTTLVQSRPVKRIGVIAGQVERPRAVADALAAVLDIDPGTYAQAIRGGGPEQFVEAIALRPLDFASVRDGLAEIPEVEVYDGSAQLAPSREFARALLGEVRELTAEQLEDLGAPYVPGDIGGQSGLQAASERQLAGSPSRAVVIRINGIPTEDLYVVGGSPSRNLRTTLDRGVQLAAEDALGELDQPAALVAVQPSTGDLLAVANRPIEDSFNRALEGQYPPGSTFKIITTAALLNRGLVEPGTVVQCPVTANVGGREFHNFEGGGGSSMTFAYAFAQSCNTAFVPFAERLAPEDLTANAELFGIGTKPHPALPVYGGQVPSAEDLVDRAAAMIGQGKVLASPAGMAGAMAAVAEGRWRVPRLVAGDPRASGEEIPASVIDQLRHLTRYVVTAGTGSALREVAGEVHGKSGTAEYGSGDPPPTHAWFVAYRDDLALAVLVEDGAAGGTVAAPIAARFFQAIDG